MFNSDTEKEIIIINLDAKKILTDWFDILSERDARPDGTRINGRARRAELRRMEPPFGVMMCEGYDALFCKLASVMPLKPVDKMALAIFVSVAVHIKNSETGRSFAAQLGEKIKDKPCLTPSRFERLQQAEEPEVLCVQLIRAVKLRGKEGVNIVSLADGIFLWMREWQDRQEDLPVTANPFARNRIRWASEYLSSAR
ncbi:type I-E CRISPR-associated protein Cse2/CasB [Pantoea sp. BAV 3049]|uniref:type I-E CRISPR-associated protein Cse2/CasB n=1 Tax=Pantoea sp. BAV 3049 TaxID=2654188 RepID=UPI00131E3400|nr:type I-E CRISPR-associated protein Cse2/CasB [Pantoea sp. BAV 3049]